MHKEGLNWTLDGIPIEGGFDVLAADEESGGLRFAHKTARLIRTASVREEPTKGITKLTANQRAALERAVAHYTDTNDHVGLSNALDLLSQAEN